MRCQYILCRFSPLGVISRHFVMDSEPSFGDALSYLVDSSNPDADQLQRDWEKIDGPKAVLVDVEKLTLQVRACDYEGVPKLGPGEYLVQPCEHPVGGEIEKQLNVYEVLVLEDPVKRKMLGYDFFTDASVIPTRCNFSNVDEFNLVGNACLTESLFSSLLRYVLGAKVKLLGHRIPEHGLKSLEELLTEYESSGIQNFPDKSFHDPAGLTLAEAEARKVRVRKVAQSVLENWAYVDHANRSQVETFTSDIYELVEDLDLSIELYVFFAVDWLNISDERAECFLSCLLSVHGRRAWTKPTEFDYMNPEDL